MYGLAWYLFFFIARSNTAWPTVRFPDSLWKGSTRDQLVCTEYDPLYPPPHIRSIHSTPFQFPSLSIVWATMTEPTPTAAVPRPTGPTHYPHPPGSCSGCRPASPLHLPSVESAHRPVSSSIRPTNVQGSPSGMFRNFPSTPIPWCPI